jgi:hypothetical protein
MIERVEVARFIVCALWVPDADSGSGLLRWLTISPAEMMQGP